MGCLDRMTEVTTGLPSRPHPEGIPALDRIRTGDPHLTMVVLYRLSYKGMKWTRKKVPNRGIFVKLGNSKII